MSVRPPQLCARVLQQRVPPCILAALLAGSIASHAALQLHPAATCSHPPPASCLMPLPARRCLPFPACPPSCRDYTRLDPRLHFLDCGDRFLTPDQRAIDAGLMPDALHPSVPGYELLAQCLDPLVTKLVQRPLAA